jgi:hypothetical protein
MPSIGFASARNPDRVLMITAEISITRALPALQRRGYIPIGLDRDEPRARCVENRAAVGGARGKAEQRFEIAQRPERSGESRVRRPAPLWIRASQTIEA